MKHATTVGLLFVALALPSLASAFESDDFHCPTLQSIWAIEDPLGDGSVDAIGSGTGDAWLELSLPSGVAHDAWGAGGLNEALRVMQDATNTDFEIEVRWKAEPTGGFADQGVLVEQDADNWLRFDVYHNNASLKIFLGTTVAGVNTAILNANIAPGSASSMRVLRVADLWRIWLSGDGVTYTEVGQFTQALTVTRVGPYAANPVEALAWTSQVDWFFDTATPIDPEDSVDTDDCEGPVSIDDSSWGSVKAKYLSHD